MSRAEAQAEAWRRSVRKRIAARDYLSRLQDHSVTVPTSNIRRISHTLAERADEIQERFSKTQAEGKHTGPVTPTKAKQYILDRFQIARDLDKFIKDAHREIESPEVVASTQKNLRKRARSDMQQISTIVSRERAILVGERAKVQFKTAYHSNHSTNLGEAYMHSIVESLPLPSGAHASYKTKDKRASNHQSAFRSNVREAYHFPSSDRSLTWCPITGERDQEAMVAAHIVPQCIGEINASYLFGLDGLGDGHESLWGSQNGMWVGKTIDKAMDAARIVFVPCSKDEEGEIKILVLDGDLMKENIGGPLRLTFGQIDGKPLQFKTDAKPSMTSLYIHALFTVLRRKTYGCKGWELDIPKVFTGRVWADMEEHKLKKSTLVALAAEVGDLSEEQMNLLELEGSGLVQSGAGTDTIAARDLEMAVLIRGSWWSQEEVQEWADLSSELEDFSLENDQGED